MMQVVYLCKTRGRINKSNGPVRYVLSLLHGKSDEFRFVEILGDFARLDGVDGADGDEEDVEDLADQEGRVLHSALEDSLVSLRVGGPRARRLHPHPEDRAQQLVNTCAAIKCHWQREQVLIYIIIPGTR